MRKVAAATTLALSATLVIASAARGAVSVHFGKLHRGVETIGVNDRVSYQRIIGFGAAMTDTSAWLLYDELTPRTRARVMAELASVDNYVRVPIAATDFTHTGVPYTYSPRPGVFSIRHDSAYIVPALRMLRREDPSVEFLSEPWSYPPWMKANDAFDNINWTGGLLPQDYRDAADYIVDFLRAYAHAGLPITAVTPINEGGTASAYPGTTINDEPRYIMSYLRPTIRAAGLHTLIYDLDGSGFGGEEQWLTNPAYRAAIAGTAVHCYAGLGPMSQLHALEPGNGLIMSECSPGHTAYPTIETLIVSLRNWAQAVDLWNIALDPAGGPKQDVPGCDHCGALVTVNERTHQATLTSNYRQLAQIARYVHRGAVRIFSTRPVTDWTDPSTAGNYGVTAGLDDVAVRNPDGTIALIAYNNSSRAIRFQLAWHGRGFVYDLGPAKAATFTWTGSPTLAGRRSHGEQHDLRRGASR